MPMQLLRLETRCMLSSFKRTQLGSRESVCPGPHHTGWGGLGQNLPEHKGASTFSTAAEDTQATKLSRERSGKDRARDPESRKPSTQQTEWEATENSREQTYSQITKTKETADFLGNSPRRGQGKVSCNIQSC